MLYDHQGGRKYLTASERRTFIQAAADLNLKEETFCLTLAYTGARISEVLSLAPNRIDFAVQGIIIETLKRRRSGIFRTVPVPQVLLERLELAFRIKEIQCDPPKCRERLWPWSRTTAWALVKKTMNMAGIIGPWAMPKGLRHALAVEGTTEAGIPLNVMQRWLGHARIETTAIYANAVGKEERNLAARTWL